MMEINLTSKKNVQLIKVMIELCSGCDGETMQHILEKSGKDEQMFKQLMVKNKLGRRLQFIKDDVDNITKWLGEMKVNDEVYGSDGSNVITYLNNILIACDLTDDEPNNWMTHAENRKKKTGKTELALCLNYGRVNPSSDDPDDLPLRHLGIHSFRLIHGGIYLEDSQGKEHTIKYKNDYFYYDGIYWTDVWVQNNDDVIELFDATLI